MADEFDIETMLEETYRRQVSNLIRRYCEGRSRVRDRVRIRNTVLDG